MRKIYLIERERDFISHHLRETLNPWIAILPIFRDFKWKTCQTQRDFTWNGWNYANRAITEINYIALKWKVIPWNAKTCFQAWIFREREITDPSLVYIGLKGPNLKKL